MINFLVHKVIDDDTIEITITDTTLVCHYSNYNNLSIVEGEKYLGEFLELSSDNIKITNENLENQITSNGFWSYFVVGIYKKIRDEYFIEISPEIIITVNNELPDSYLNFQVELKIERLDLLFTPNH
jgi:hypothetical protein